MEDLPDFLRIPQGERRAAWAGRKPTKQGSMFKVKQTKVEEAATRQLRRELAAAEEAQEGSTVRSAQRDGRRTQT